MGGNFILFRHDGLKTFTYIFEIHPAVIACIHSQFSYCMSRMRTFLMKFHFAYRLSVVIKVLAWEKWKASYSNLIFFRQKKFFCFSIHEGSFSNESNIKSSELRSENINARLWTNDEQNLKVMSRFGFLI
jgi:hypothetical protein